MKTILDEIILNRRREIEEQKQRISLPEIQSAIDSDYVCNSLSARLSVTGSSGIIAEFKRQSPSKGIINNSANPEIVTKAYADAGVSGISVLTETRFFGGSIMDFEVVRNANPGVPVLRKDFIIDKYQLYESRMIKADVVLLIAAVLQKEEIAEFTSIAHELGMEVLLELHDESEITKIDPGADLIGINNRNLKDFKVDLDRSINLLSKLPEHAIKVSESGLSDPSTVDFLRSQGFQGFLMGENFMKSPEPGEACRDFISKLGFQGR